MSKTKQKSLNIHQMLSLCDPHHSIVTNFGLDTACQKTASICKKGCHEHEHRIKSHKHEFLPAKQLYSLIKLLRDRFKEFDKNFKSIYLQSFIKDLKECINNFEEYVLKECLQSHPLIQNFCRFSNHYSDTLQQIIEQPLEDIELASLTCKDISSVRILANIIEKQTSQNEKMRVNQQLRCLLENYLNHKKILPSSNRKEEKKNRSPEIIQVDRFIQLSQRIDFSTKNFNLLKIGDFREIDRLQVKIKEDLSGKFELKLPLGVKNAEIDGFFSSLQNYLSLVHPQTFVLTINYDTNQNIFWERLLNLLANKKSVKQLIIVTTKPPDSQFIKKQAQIYHSNLNVRIHNNINWIDNYYAPVLSEESQAQKEKEDQPFQNDANKSKQ